jgi:hypothetical protein
MAELKTKQNELSVDDFLNKVADENVRKDCYAIIKLMEKITGCPPKMWGTAIIGFGKYHYKYESGREGDICMIGFSPRKQNITLYVKAAAAQEDLFEKLGKHKSGKDCVYIKKLDDIDIKILEKIIRGTIKYLKNKYRGK